ncbi:MAG TPA: putative metalloprotease CJM1_0395 family protein [Anaerolineaceae bacterium]|nr:putative metalloprotease CJM1_0395 family protein [Anaerolineaceae bacterium]HPN52318.1 putative metalloprotease CJM1_0395 family protein [Anaerolineaceae bacterium]
MADELGAIKPISITGTEQSDRSGAVPRQIPGMKPLIPPQTDQAIISPEAKEKARDQQNGKPQSQGQGSSAELSDSEQREVEDLKQRDREVRAHEQAHIAAGGGLVRGGAAYEYKRGPDDKLYAVGGEVTIDTSKEDEPEATIAKAQRIRTAALAPADPSAQDRSVAAQASNMEMEARSELQEQKAEEASGAAQGSGGTGKSSETGKPAGGSAAGGISGAGESQGSSQDGSTALKSPRRPNGYAAALNAAAGLPGAVNRKA